MRPRDLEADRGAQARDRPYKGQRAPTPLSRGRAVGAQGHLILPYTDGGD